MLHSQARLEYRSVFLLALKSLMLSVPHHRRVDDRERPSVPSDADTKLGAQSETTNRSLHVSRARNCIIIPVASRAPRSSTMVILAPCTSFHVLEYKRRGSS